MTSSHEGQRHDLFDFPEVEGLEEFGLVPPVPADLEVAAPAEAPAVAPVVAPAEITPAVDPVAAGPIETASTTPVSPEAETQSDATDGSGFVMEPARPNPPVPAGVTDLDEDLFQFDEVFSLEEDPYFNGTLALDGTPTNPVFLDDSSTDAPPTAVEDPILGAVPHQTEPQATVQATAPDAAPVIDPAAAPSAPSTAPDPAPVQQAASEPTLPESITPAAAPSTEPVRAAVPLMASVPDGMPPAASRTAGATATLDRGPRILLPEDVPYSATGERQRYIWALIACFLLINTGIFVLAHQASSNFQNTMSAATGLLADAITRQNDAPTHAAAPVTVPYVEHTVDTREDETETAEPWVDPTGYSSPHKFAVANAKALMGEGRFEDARRQLNYVLANKARVPLAPSLREEIDYLIPLTYYEQGNATAPESDR